MPGHLERPNLLRLPVRGRHAGRQALPVSATLLDHRVVRADRSEQCHCQLRSVVGVRELHLPPQPAGECLRALFRLRELAGNWIAYDRNLGRLVPRRQPRFRLFRCHNAPTFCGERLRLHRSIKFTELTSTDLPVQPAHRCRHDTRRLSGCGSRRPLKPSTTRRRRWPPRRDAERPKRRRLQGCRGSSRKFRCDAVSPSRLGHSTQLVVTARDHNDLRCAVLSRRNPAAEPWLAEVDQAPLRST